MAVCLLAVIMRPRPHIVCNIEGIFNFTLSGHNAITHVLELKANLAVAALQLNLPLLLFTASSAPGGIFNSSHEFFPLAESKDLVSEGDNNGVKTEYFVTTYEDVWLVTR